MKSGAKWHLWQRHVDEMFLTNSKDGLLATILVKHPSTNKYHVNLDNALFLMIKEVKCLERMGFAIPEVAKLIFNQEEKLRVHSERLQFMLKQYYRVFALPMKIYAHIFQPLLDKTTAFLDTV